MAVGFVFPAIGLLTLAGILVSVHGEHDTLPFTLTCLFFLATFLSRGIMFWPYRIPYSVAAASAAAPDASLRFLLYAGIVVLPIITVYTFTGCFAASFARVTGLNDRPVKQDSRPMSIPGGNPTGIRKTR
jgi:cytochrome bd-type quinol oxidase subunit 2